MLVIKYYKSVRSGLLIALCCILVSGLSSCHTSRKQQSGPGHPHVENIHIGKTSKSRQRIVKEAYTWLGTPYKYACEEKGKATDCSGMVMKIYEKVAGIKLPRNSAKQAAFCKEMSAGDVDAGDLVFFATGRDPSKVSHVGIVIDNKSFIHASASKGVVISKFSNNYFKRTFVKFGRVPNMK